MKKIYLLILSCSILSCSQNKSNEQHDDLKPIERLKLGNQRFVQGQPVHPDETLERLRKLKQGQHPFAVVVSCSDSRIPPELVFDQGLGDIFSIRTAGNVIGDYELGSIEYAVEHLKCNLIVVLGHENCGAIDAFVNSNHHHHKDHIQSIIKYIEEEEEEEKCLDSIRFNPDVAVRANIKHGVASLRNSTPILKQLFQKKQLTIIGAYYDLDTGEVSFDEK